MHFSTVTTFGYSKGQQLFILLIIYLLRIIEFFLFTGNVVLCSQLSYQSLNSHLLSLYTFYSQVVGSSC